MDYKRIDQAKYFAQSFHKSHTRVSGENYFDHIERVAQSLIDNMVEDENLIIITYLHHILDFKEGSQVELEKVFGKDIVKLLELYKSLSDSDVSDISPQNNEKYILQAYLNLAKDPKILILRLADKTDSIKTAHLLEKEKAQKVAERALYIYAPICRLLGIISFVSDLEDGALKILNPGSYYKIKSYLDSMLPEIKLMLSDSRELVSEILEENNIRANVTTRIKHIYSIYRKSQKPKNSSKLMDIHDIVGMRILVNTVEECYIAENLLKQLWEEVPGERDDYILKPRPSGYRGIHDTFILTNKLNFEVQIKTFQMHEENEFGSASHTFYKIGEYLKKLMKTNPNILREINYTSSLESTKIDYFSRNVYVFTPNGDIIELRRGSNLIDFAYAIHDDVGNSCTGGNVNGRFEKLTYILQDGDKVEIKTSKSKKSPSADWLESVKSEKAKDSIRKALKNRTL